MNTFVRNLFWCSPGHGSDCATHWLIACSRFSDSEEDAKVKGARKVGGTGKRKKEKGSSRFSSCFRTRLSRSLKQANWCTAQGSLAVLGSIFAVCAVDLSVSLPHYSLFLSQLWTPSWSFLDKCNFAIPTYS